MDAFERELDSWKADHIEAMACMDFALYVQGAIAVREGIESLDERVDNVAKDDRFKVGVMRRVLRNLAQRWLNQCEDIDREARGFADRDFAFKGMVEFQRLWRDIPGCATVQRTCGSAWTDERIDDSHLPASYFARCCSLGCSE